MATTIYSSSGDGFVRNNGSGSWSSLQSASTGTAASQFNPALAPYNDGTTADKYIDRGVFSFDLSSIPSGATITAATLRLYVTAKDSGAGGSVGITSASPASTTTLATSDFGNFGTTEYATRINFSAATTSAYNDFVLNSAGLTYLTGKVGTSAGFGVRGSFDIDNSAPGTTVFSSWSVSTSEQSGTSQDPKLEVSYSLSKTTSDSWAWTDDAAAASSLTASFGCSAGDGRVRNTAAGTDSGTFTTVRAAATGSSADDTSTAVAGPYSDTTTGGSTTIDRLFLPFDTSGLPDAAQVWSATVSFVPDVVYASGSVCLVAGTQASTSALSTADFDEVGSTELAYNRIPCSSMVAGSRYTFRLNAAGLAQISKTGVSKFALRTSYDLDNTYSAATISGIQTRLSEYAGSASDPSIGVSYWFATTSKTTTDTWAWSDTAAPYRRSTVEVTVKDQGANTLLNQAGGVIGATITVDDTTGFASSGTLFIISGYQQAVGTYTGKTGTTFTGCSWTSLVGRVTYADGSLNFDDNSAIGAPDAEAHFPQITKLDTTSTPVLMCSYQLHGGHAALRGKLAYKLSTNGGITWGSEQYIVSSPANGSAYGVFGHTMCRMKNGRLIAIWYEHKLDYTAADSIASFKTMMSYSDDSAVSWSTPTKIDLNMGYSNDDGTNGFGSMLYTGSGSNSTYGDLYLPVVGNKDGIQVHGSGEPYRWELWLYKITDGGASSTATKVAEVFTYTACGNRACGEGDLTIAENGDWIMQSRIEPNVATDASDQEKRNRWQSRSTDNGVTWSSPVKIIDAFANAAEVTKLPGGTLISTGSPVLAADANYGQTGTVLSHDNGTTWTRTIKWEATDVTYAIYNGADTEVIIDDASTLVNTAFTYAQERSNQTGARTMFRWYVDPVKRTSDTWAWSDSATGRITASFKTTSDAWAWTDTATKTQTFSRTGYNFLGSFNYDFWSWSDVASQSTVSSISRTTSDSWAWSETATRTVAYPRSAADTLAWSDTAVVTSTGPSFYSRTTTDTWAWADAVTSSAAIAYFWLRRQRSSMSAPTKTYVQVQGKGTTRTATWTSPTYKAETEAGVLVVLDVTSASGTGGLTLRINAHDQASSQAVPLNAAPSAVTTTGTTSYALYPFGAVAGSVTQATSFYLPRMFSITVTHGDSSSYDYSVGFCLLP